MADYIEIDFLGVETAKSGDAIALRYSIGGIPSIHVVDGGYLETGKQIVEHLSSYYSTDRIDHLVLTHPDQDHANGLRIVIEQCKVGTLWMNRPWIYAEELLERFPTYTSVTALRNELRSVYGASAALEELAIEKGIAIKAPFQGELIGQFRVLTPTKERFLDLVVQSSKTPKAASEGLLAEVTGGLLKAFKAAANLVKSAWGQEYFPAEGTSSENEMSVVQHISVSNRSFLLTGDTGRDGLTDSANFAEYIGIDLPGVFAFQVPHHGGRHNVSTETLDRWLGARLEQPPTTTNWNAVCSSAKADEDHPRKSVVRAMLHRGAHFAATEGRTVRIAIGIDREGWKEIPQSNYPEEQEE
jgi:beta-lactamase superfamily II metal-dependent hydrolase